jgi:hypothetical protein
MVLNHSNYLGNHHHQQQQQQHQQRHLSAQIQQLRQVVSMMASQGKQLPPQIVQQQLAASMALQSYQMKNQTATSIGGGDGTQVMNCNSFPSNQTHSHHAAKPQSPAVTGIHTKHSNQLPGLQQQDPSLIALQMKQLVAKSIVQGRQQQQRQQQQQEQLK